MTPLRNKDRIFLAVVLPVALTAAYWFGWRAAAGRRLAADAARAAVLVSAEDFPSEMARAKRARDAALAERDAARKLPPPRTCLRGDPGEGAAQREKYVLDTLREAGLSVLKSAPAKEAGAGGECLKATGVRPAPVCRTYTVAGVYPRVAAALAAFARRELAVVPARLRLEDSARGTWTLEVWE